MSNPKHNGRSPVSDNKDCIFCFRGDEDDPVLGRIHRSKGIAAHFYCMLFASGLAQNGKTKEGIKGFLIQDIIKEVRRGKPWKCVYCKKSGATVGCNIKKCLKVFHFPCGLENGALNHYFGTFETYCKDHKPKQNFGKLANTPVDCSICFNEPTKISHETHLKSPCCVSGWFHRTCIQAYASSAGYFFKCPHCKDSDDFRREMLKYGIAIPDQDASWERERNAFSELLERPECGAENCSCPKGRAWNEDYEMWELMYCKNCGSVARHVKCGNLSLGDVSWTCNDCKKLEKEFEAKIFQQMKNQYGLTEFSIVLEDIFKKSRVVDGPVESKNTTGKKRKMPHKGKDRPLPKKKASVADVSSQKPPGPSKPSENTAAVQLLHKCQQNISNYMRRYGDCSTSTGNNINVFLLSGKENLPLHKSAEKTENFNGEMKTNLLMGEKASKLQSKSGAKAKNSNKGLKRARANCKIDENQMTILKYLNKQNDYLNFK